MRTFPPKISVPRNPGKNPRPQPSVRRKAGAFLLAGFLAFCLSPGLPFPPSGGASAEAQAAGTGWVPPEGYGYSVVQLAHFSLELLSKKGSASPYAILQLHGGAFVEGMNDRYRQFAVRYSQIFGDCLVASPDYRLAPGNPYPCQQEDALAAWTYLTETLGYAANRIVVAGDSAGGNLALSLGLRLRDGGAAMPLAFVCLSAWADLSNSGASHWYNATKDACFGVPADEYAGGAVGVDSSYADGLDATVPAISPSFGDYAGFPPMLLQVGSAEVLLSDSETVYENAKNHGVDCRLTVYKDIYHVFQAVFGRTSASRLAWREIGDFLAAAAGLPPS